MGMGLRSLKTCLALIVFTATVSGASANGSPEPAVANYQETRTRFIVANGTRYAYRRFGNESGVPLVLFAHFRASMDNWDPQLLNRLAERRTIIAINNKGVRRSRGQRSEERRGGKEGVSTGRNRGQPVH